MRGDDVVLLLEREEQLASLGEYAREAGQGDGRLVFVAGEAGVGKSALVEQAQRDLPEARWYWGACDGLFTPRPLGPLLDMTRTLGGEVLELCRTDAPREELFSALLRQVSAPGGLHVLVVEDVHWADEATIDLLRFLSRRIRQAPVLIMATYRHEGLAVTDPLRIALGDLATQRSVRRLDLPPLSAGAVAVEELLRAGGSSPAIRLCPLNTLGTIRARRGEPGAWAGLEESIEYANRAGEPQLIVAVRLARAEAFWLDGRRADARHEAELADDAARGCDGWDRGAVAVWLRRTGSARPPRGRLAAPYQRQVDGDPNGAARLWTDLGCPYEAGLALLDSGDESSLLEALRIFTEVGAPATAQLTRQTMRRLGIRSIPNGPRTATRAHPLGLTRREREVLDLICAGHTNTEIAGKLFISVKTAGHHVSAVLAKLNVPTRRAAATRAAKLGLVAVG